MRDDIKMVIGWDRLAILIKEYGDEEGTKIFLSFVASAPSIKRQVDELDRKESNG